MSFQFNESKSEDKYTLHHTIVGPFFAVGVVSLPSTARKDGSCRISIIQMKGAWSTSRDERGMHGKPA